MTSDFDLGHRRMRTLGDLAVLVGGRTALDEVGPTAAAALAANNTDLPFVRLYRCAGPGEPRLVGAVPAGTEATDPAGVPAVLAEVIAGGMPVTLPAEHFTEQAGDVQRALATPLADGTETLGVLVAGLNPKLDQAGPYREFLDRVATMIAAALVTAGAYEQDQRSIAALSDLDRAKTDLFANASHELRTPLTLVSAPAEEALADTDEPLPPAQRERIRLVRRNAARLRRLLNNILDFTKITSGGLHAELVATELAEQTRAIAASFAPAVRRGGLEFVVDCPPLSRVAFVDREMWERIVLNLLSNALKFTLHGKITLRLAGDEHEVAMSVEDTGIGVPPEHVPLLFRRFHRVQGAVGRTGEGAGIGLALVHELVALHEGSVAVHSTLGAGSTFEVRIPYGSGAMSGVSRGPGWVREVHLAEAFGWVGSEAQEPLPGSTDGPPVLVAEDNIDMRNYLETLLAPHWPVRTAADGAAALALAKETRPALVLTDVSMPEMDGLALVDALRADPATQGIPIILLSAQAGVEATAAGLHAGADDYLVKPFSPVELLARVRSSIELAQLRQHHSEREAIQARFAVQLAEATDMRDVLSAAVAELGTSWDAGAVVVVSWDADGAGHVIAPPDGSSWETLPRHVRDVLDELRHRVGLAALARPANPATGAGAGVGATIDVLGDDTAVWLELPDNRPLASADRNLLRALCGQLGLALSRARSYEQQRTVAVTLQRSLLGPTVL
ncbi:MAG TPA: ATP-binding protein, partial [Actinophytocola sp.]|nr:ATP-binding protein [Actinophytocola sp.]